MIINGGVWLRDSVGGLGWISVASLSSRRGSRSMLFTVPLFSGSLRVLKYYVPKNTYADSDGIFRCPSVHYHRIGAGDRVDA